MREKVRPHRAFILLAVLLVALALLWEFFFQERFLRLAYPEKYPALVQKYASQNNLSPYLLFAVIRTESGFDPKAQSSIGARGLMQLTPDTFDWAQEKAAAGSLLSSDKLYDPETNIHYGAVVLSAYLREFGSVGTAVAAYHAGRSKVKSWLADRRYSRDGRTLYYIPFDDTRAYVKRVLETEKMYQKIYSS